MKCKLLEALLVSLLMLGLCGCGDNGNNPSSNHGTIAYYTAGQSGTNCSPWGDGSASDQPAMAVEFTPPSYPLTISSVTIYAVNNTGSIQYCNIYGYSDLSTETSIFNPVLNNSIPDTGSSPQAITINIPTTTITSGSFYIAVGWVTKPLSSVSGANAFFLHTDSHMDYPNTSYISTSSSAWSTLESVSSSAGDLGIEVNY